MDGKIRYARTSDGVDIAYATHGSGPMLLVARPLLRTAVDGELGWMDPALPLLADQHTVVTWDWRSLGLSTTNTAEYTLDSTLRDMEAVADAAGAETFDLMASMTPCHSAVAFAARNPTRIRRMVLWNPSPSGMSPRSTTLAHLPDIASTHFKQYIELAALSIFGWDRADVAKRWERDIVAQFTANDWLRLMDQMEQVDGTNEIHLVQALTLVVLDLTAVDAHIVTPSERQAFVRSVAANIPRSELAIIKRGGGRTYGEVVRLFLAGDAPREDDRPHGTAIILFADIVDSTAMTDRMGNAAFRERSTALEARIRDAVRAHGGESVAGRTLGDGVLATFRSAAQGIAAALDCAEAGGDLGLALHLGIHAGDVLREDGNVHGIAVSLASRVSGLTGPNEIFVSQTVRDLARASSDVTFEDRGEHALKGVGDLVRVYAVRGAA